MAGTMEAVVRYVWVDDHGFVHERKPGETMARCGAEYQGMSHRTPCPRPCQTCIEDALREYALTHDCKESGCVAVASSGQPN